VLRLKTKPWVFGVVIFLFVFVVDFQIHQKIDGFESNVALRLSMSWNPTVLFGIH
jgi:hypothetical protein